jgi:acid phosphatase (class A)
VDPGGGTVTGLGAVKQNARRALGVLVVAGALGAITWWWWNLGTYYLKPEAMGMYMEVLERTGVPTAPESAQTRRELDELLELQRTRSAADVAAARADRKTELSRFYGALGIDPRDPPRLVRLNSLIDAMERTSRPYVRHAKRDYSRSRPYVIEPRLEPCIADVRDDWSYPSGHASYGYLVGYLLMDMVPERSAQIEARMAEFARQRMVCGVHFGSDIRAGKAGAALLFGVLTKNMEFVADFQEASRELRTALNLPLL